MASSDMNLDLIISATDLASKEIKRIQGELKRLTTETDGVGKASNGVFGSLKAGWLAVGAAVTGAIVAVGKFASEAIDVSISYESAFAGVRKTVDATEEEFDQLNQTLKDMETPTTFEELAHIMELGGQLGVTTDNLAEFTEVIDKLAVSTNLTSEEAATLAAQFANVTRMDMSNIDRWGSTIVKLGNNMATTEKDITNFSQRIAAAAANMSEVGMSESDILGIAAAFESMGVEAEAGGTAVSKVMNDMKTSIAIGSVNMQKYAKYLGITEDEFKALVKNNPTKAFVDFNKVLAASGDNINAILYDLEFKDVRLNDAFGRMAGNVDVLTDALQLANEGREENIALTNEASQRFATTESQIAIAQKERANTMAELGDSLKPIVLLWENVKTVALGFLADVLGPIASGIGDWVQSFQEAGEGGKTMIESMKESFQSFKDWAVETFGPLIEAIKNFWNEHGEEVKVVLGVIGEAIKTAIELFVDNFQSTIAIISDLINFVTAVFSGDWESAINAVNSLFNNLVNRVKNVLDTILGFFGTSFDEVSGIVSRSIDSVVDFIKGGFERACSRVKTTFVDPVLGWIDTIKSAWNSLFGSDTGKKIGSFNVPAPIPHANGGPVSTGTTYLVGEKGPELFVPKTSGEIIPNDELNKGSGSINISINGTTVNNQSDIDSLVDTLIRRIKLERNFGIA